MGTEQKHDQNLPLCGLPATVPDKCRIFMDSVGFGVMMIDAATHQIIDVNKSALAMLGAPREEVVGRICHKYVCPAEQGQCPVSDLGRTIDRSERTLCCCGGPAVPILKTVIPIQVDGREILLESMVDITVEKEAQAKLKASEERFILASRGANDGLWDWNLQTHQVYYSERWRQMLGLHDQNVPETLDTWLSRVHPEDILELKSELARHLEGTSPHFESEHRVAHRDGHYLWMLTRGQALRDKKGTAVRMAGSQTDITARKQAEEELRRGAFYDSLTGLANRALLVDRLDRCIARAQRQKDYLFSVMFLDLDRFKVVNDSLGHQTGDNLLIAVGERLRMSLRTSDTIGLRTDATHTVARMGGDEFTLLLEDIRTPDDAVRVAERIQQLLSDPLVINGQEIFTAASIGIATYEGGNTTADKMLRDADTALYRAKAEGRGNYAVFDQTMHSHAIRRLTIERDLRRALELNQFRLAYQPIVSLITDRIIGVEALLRWNHPERGLIPPAEFIPVAEEMGLIVPIGWFVLNEACTQLVQWQKQYPTDPPLSIAVNLSSLQIRQKDLVLRVREVLHNTDLDATSLHLEITESALLENDKHTIETLNGLKNLGISLHMDDFGTGYSSLSYLHQFPIDVVKVDQAFIRELEKQGEQRGLVNSIVAMAHNLGKEVIAEGIETAGQLSRLKAIACQQGQGYYLSKPVTAAEFADVLQRDVQGEFLKGLTPVLTHP